MSFIEDLWEKRSKGMKFKQDTFVVYDPNSGDFDLFTDETEANDAADDRTCEKKSELARETIEIILGLVNSRSISVEGDDGTITQKSLAKIWKEFDENEVGKRVTLHIENLRWQKLKVNRYQVQCIANGKGIKFRNVKNNLTKKDALDGLLSTDILDEYLTAVLPAYEITPIEEYADL